MADDDPMSTEAWLQHMALGCAWDIVFGRTTMAEAEAEFGPRIRLHIWATGLLDELVESDDVLVRVRPPGRIVGAVWRDSPADVVSERRLLRIAGRLGLRVDDALRREANSVRATREQGGERVWQRLKDVLRRGEGWGEGFTSNAFDPTDDAPTSWHGRGW